MHDKTIAPYGSWKSPITPDRIVAETVGFSGISIDGEDVYWLEMRPEEGGRYVLVRHVSDGIGQDVTPPLFSVRSRVHEYGGFPYAVRDGVVVFSNFADNKLYLLKIGEAPKAISDGSTRFVDFEWTSHGLIAVGEKHLDHVVENFVARIDPKTGETFVLASGHDFYAHLYLAQALYISSDPDWGSYFQKRRDFLLDQQQSDGSWWGDGVGDVYGTALALIILQLPYNQLPIMQP